MSTRSNIAIKRKNEQLIQFIVIQMDIMNIMVLY